MTIPQTNDGIPVGTVQDMAGRLRSTLPTGWFPVSPPPPAASSTPVLDGLLTGLATAWSYCFALLTLVVGQTRIGTASGGFLDIGSVDFFGTQLPRRIGETDDGFRSRIRAELISQHATRADLCAAVTGLTALSPLICEPNRAADCGGYGGQQQVAAGGGVGYCTTGLRYGSSLMAFQYFLSASPCVAFAPGSVCRRETPATFVNSQGLIQSAPPRTLRPLYKQGVCIGSLAETRAFNLITDSRLASGFSQSPSPEAGVSTWKLDYSMTGLFEADPVIAIVGVEGIRIAGPSVDVASGGSSAAGSAWIFVAENAPLNKVELVLVDLNVMESAVYFPADMTRLGEWQRLSGNLQTQAAPGRNLRMGLVLSGKGVADVAVYTQCWQIEPGATATSYIPTSGVLGIREQDEIAFESLISEPTSFTISDLESVVAANIPAATIAWIMAPPAYR